MHEVKHEGFLGFEFGPSNEKNGRFPAEQKRGGFNVPLANGGHGVVVVKEPTAEGFEFQFNPSLELKKGETFTVPLKGSKEELARQGLLAMTRAELEAFQRMTPEEQAEISRLLLAKQRAELRAVDEVALLQHPAARLSKAERKRRSRERRGK